MRSKGFKIFIFFFFLNYITALSQNIIKGKIISSDKDFQNDIVEIYAGISSIPLLNIPYNKYSMKLLQ